MTTASKSFSLLFARLNKDRDRFTPLWRFCAALVTMSGLNLSTTPQNIRITFNRQLMVKCLDFKGKPQTWWYHRKLTPNSPPKLSWSISWGWIDFILSRSANSISKQRCCSIYIACVLFYKIFRAFRSKKERTEPNISPLNYEDAVVYNSFLCHFKAIYFYSSLVKASIQVKTITQSTEDEANEMILPLSPDQQEYWLLIHIIGLHTFQIVLAFSLLWCRTDF